LTRIEGIIAEGGKHPFFYLKSGEINKYEELLFRGINKISEYFDELWIRTSDIRTDEYKNLEGSPKQTEANPMLGMHGIRASLKNPEILKAELKAMKRVADTGKKIGILSPQVISVDEVKKLKQAVKDIGGGELKVGVMVETPAAVEIIEDLCKEGIEFISFGTNDLTQYTLAIDRGNEAVQYLYDELHPAILNQLAHVISVCKKHGVETSICGQAGSRKEMVEFLVKKGIDSISVNADKAKEISELVKRLEDEGKRGSETGNPDEEEKVEEKETEDKEDEVERDNFGRKLYPAVCTKCKKETKVPFKPQEGREVYCKECFKNKNKQEKKQEKNTDNDKTESVDKEGESKSKEEEKPREADEKKKKDGGWKEDVSFGVDVFASQEKKEEKKPVEAIEAELEEETGEKEESINDKTKSVGGEGEEQEEDKEEDKEEAEEIQKLAENDAKKERKENHGEDRGGEEEVLDIF
jgi:CxxC-x17-CxxC domain-containing protein